MAETQSPLEQLADISEPPLELAFALAPLWWFLIGLSAASLCYLLLLWYRRWQYFAAKRQALKLLESLMASEHAASEINQLLKRVLQHYQPKHPALSMPPEQWQHWLRFQHSQPLPDLAHLLYQPGQQAEASKQFYQFAKVWLSQYNAKAPTSIAIPEASNA
jgi:hypothetical protein